MKKSKLIIIGSGPAAYTAAIYAARAELQPIVYEGFSIGPPGGQLMTTTEVENYPGFPEGVMGPEMMDLFRRQAERFGTCLITEDVTDIHLQSRPFKVVTISGPAEAEAVIVATGATARRLDVPGADKFWQKGITACAICDGAVPIFRDKHLYVFGGGDTACEDALFLTKFGSKVFIVHRRDQFRASKVLSHRVLNHPKIRVIWNHVLSRIDGDSVVRSVTLKNVLTGHEDPYEAGGVFFAIGLDPNTNFLKGQLELHPNGYIKVVPGTTRTNIEGVFAAGDVQDHVYRQAVTAAGSGCMAALDAERWLSHQEYLYA